MTVQILRPNSLRSARKSARTANEMQRIDEQRRAFLHHYARQLVLEHRQAIRDSTHGIRGKGAGNE